MKASLGWLPAMAVVCLVVTASAATDPVRKCEAAKLSAAGKAAAATLKCHAKAATKGTAVDPTCLQKAETKMAAAFSKAEKTVACPSVDDATSVNALADALGTHVATAIPAGADGAKCAGKKIKVAGKRTRAMLKALAKDRKKADAEKLTAALAKADEKFGSGFDAAQSKLTCETTDDDCTIPVPIDDYVQRVAAIRFSGCPDQLLYGTEGNRMRRYDVDTIGTGALIEDIFIERASLDPGGRDVNGPICALPDASGGFVCGEDTGQPATPAGWGAFDASGTQIGKNTATYYRDPGEPFSCAFNTDGTLFTTSVGDQPVGNNGQLILWFPPYNEFPGPPGDYPNTTDSSANYCKLSVDLSIAGNVAVGLDGAAYVTQALGGRVHRFLPPFPTAPEAGGGCGQVDALGSPFADSVTQELFINDATNVPTPTGLAQIANGHWFVSSVFTGVIAEYDDAGSFIRRVLQPPAGETSLPYSTGHPQSILFDCEGDLYYTDMNLTVGSGIGPGPNGAVWRIRFDKCDDPLAPELVRDGLNFPDGLGVFAGDLENP
ncbi:MAG: hypothetical protein V3R77_01365 [Candidatus Binatia bacterium]